MPFCAVVTRAAIACIVMAALADAAHAAASCKGAAEHLATLIKHNWPSPNENATVDMISTFLHKSPSGFIPGATRFKLAEYSQEG